MQQKWCVTNVDPCTNRKPQAVSAQLHFGLLDCNREKECPSAPGMFFSSLYKCCWCAYYQTHTSEILDRFRKPSGMPALHSSCVVHLFNVAITCFIKIGNPPNVTAVIWRCLPKNVCSLKLLRTHCMQPPQYRCGPDFFTIMLYGHINSTVLKWLFKTLPVHFQLSWPHWQWGIFPVDFAGAAAALQPPQNLVAINQKAICDATLNTRMPKM